MTLMSKKQLQQTSERFKQVQHSTESFWQDFRAFAFKGDVIDLAVGIVVGGAFNKIVESLTKDVIMPVFGRILGNAAFSELYINLSDNVYANLAEATAAGAPVIKIGQFITTIVDFFIISLTIYVVLRFVLKQKRKEEAKSTK